MHDACRNEKRTKNWNQNEAKASKKSPIHFWCLSVKEAPAQWWNHIEEPNLFTIRRWKEAVFSIYLGLWWNQISSVSLSCAPRIVYRFQWSTYLKLIIFVVYEGFSLHSVFKSDFGWKAVDVCPSERRLFGPLMRSLFYSRMLQITLAIFYPHVVIVYYPSKYNTRIHNQRYTHTHRHHEQWMARIKYLTHSDLQHIATRLSKSNACSCSHSCIATVCINHNISEKCNYVSLCHLNNTKWPRGSHKWSEQSTYTSATHTAITVMRIGRERESVRMNDVETFPWINKIKQKRQQKRAKLSETLLRNIHIPWYFGVQH